MEGQRLGRYRLGRRLAAGGMAEVFAATVEGAAGFEKPVAVKRILPHLCDDPDFVEMFREEARLASRLSHANIAQVFDFDVIDGQYLLAMEWVHGKDLRRVLRAAESADSPPTPARAAHVAREVARALHHAHVAEGSDGRPMGLVHRDVSPQNILISFAGEVKLTDFGIAKARSRSLATGVGVIKGKSAYMSPEQARGDSLDARSDVFALGVVLWEALTCRRLFGGDSDAEILRAVQLRPAALPSTIRGGIPGDLDAVVLRALAKDREERHESALELETELTDVLLRHAAGAKDLDLSSWMAQIFAEELEGREALLLEGVRLPKGAAARRGTARLQAPPGVAAGESFTPPPPTRSAAEGAEGGLEPERDTADIREAAVVHPIRSAALGVLALGAAAMFLAILFLQLSSGEREVGEEAAFVDTLSKIGAQPAMPPIDHGGASEEAPPDDASPDLSAEPGPKEMRRPADAAIGAAPAPSRRARGPSTRQAAGTAARSPTALADAVNPTSSEEPAPPAALAESPQVHEPSNPQEAEAPTPGWRPAGGPTILAPAAASPAMSEPDSAAATIPAGTTLTAELSFGVETGQAGEVEARLTRSHVSLGRTLLPRGARLFGRARAEDERVMIAFERLVLPSGTTHRVAAFARGEDGRPGLLAAEAMTSKARPGRRVLTLPPGTTTNVVLESRLDLE